MATDEVEHRWKYRVVYQGDDGAMDLYWTDSAADARRVAAERRGQVEGPLGTRYWGA